VAENVETMRLEADQVIKCLCSLWPGSATIPGTMTFVINRAHLAGDVKIKKYEVFDAIRLAYPHLQVVVEAGDAAGLAAACAWDNNTAGRLGVVLAEGNIDSDVSARVLGRPYESATECINRPNCLPTADSDPSMHQFYPSGMTAVQGRFVQHRDCGDPP
jgi:hypothetical protein